jgi:RimJ/RimL family protein N-acetyltransferase
MTETFDAGLIDFRWLSEDDLPLIHRWLNQGEALRWYGQKATTLDEIDAEYRPMLHGQDTAKASLITYEGVPIGYIQHYLTADEAEYWGRQRLPPGTAGIDLFIGEETFLHRGFGPLVIRRYLDERLFTDPAITACIIDPDPANVIAIRAYEKVGFRYLHTIGPPDHIEPAYLMMLTREEFERCRAARNPTVRRTS